MPTDWAAQHTREHGFAGYAYALSDPVITCIHVERRLRPVRSVAVTDKGGLMASCGCVNTTGAARFTPFETIMDRLPTADDLPLLEPGHRAERGDDGQWLVSSI